MVVESGTEREGLESHAGLGNRLKAVDANTTKQRRVHKGTKQQSEEKVESKVEARILHNIYK